MKGKRQQFCLLEDCFHVNGVIFLRLFFSFLLKGDDRGVDGGWRVFNWEGVSNHRIFIIYLNHFQASDKKF